MDDEMIDEAEIHIMCTPRKCFRCGDEYYNCSSSAYEEDDYCSWACEQEVF